MAFRSKSDAAIEELAPYIPERKEGVFDLIDRLEDLCPRSLQAKWIRNLVSGSGDVHFYFNEAGDLRIAIL